MRFLLILLILLTLFSLSFSEILIIEYGEKGVGESCTSHYECSTWLCLNGVCSNCASNSDCIETTYYCKDGRCSACSMHSDCDTLLCDNGICKKCYRNEDCLISTGLCDLSNNKCKLCEKGSDCPSGYCEFGYCKPCVSDDQCEIGVCRLGNCKSCVEVGCLNGWKCNPSNGKCYCRNLGESCELGVQCCSGKCTNGICTSVVVERGESKHPSYTGSGSSRSEEGKVKVSVEREVKASAGILYDLLGLSRKRTETSTVCVIGAVCKNEEDCCGAPCVDGYCLCSKTLCTSSGECCSGYCDEGYCKPAPKISLFAADVLKKPISEIGCAGLVEECFGEGTCISFCNIITGLVALVSIGNAGISFKKYKNPIVSFISLLLPIAVGILFYPFVGVLIGLILILFYAKA
ncbi:MAG: sodium/calcium exchanger protein [Thermoplasmata archaeon]